MSVVVGYNRSAEAARAACEGPCRGRGIPPAPPR